MRRLAFLLLLMAAACAAQTPDQLLHLAQDVYKNPNGYEFKGHITVQPADSSWRLISDLTIAAAPTPFDNPRTGATPAYDAGGNMQFVHIGTGDDPKPTRFGFPYAVVGAWDRMADNVASVRETGSETLPLNGAAVPCRILDVQYAVSEGLPFLPPATYSICSDRHLVLKKTLSFPTDRHGAGPPSQWVLTLDTASFNRPAPQWLADLKNLPEVTIRNEWLGRLAPDFTLTDLNGNSVQLSSLRGKVILLDFWSISCGPCIRELPMLEATAQRNSSALTFWSISFDPADRDKKWLADHNQSLPTLSDTNFAVSDLYTVHGIPATILIGRNGKIKNYWQGAVPEADLTAAIQHATR